MGSSDHNHYLYGTAEGSIIAPLSTSDSRQSLHVNERRRSALQRIDRAPFSLFHVKIWLVAGVGFFTDAYDIFAISIATLMLGNVYGNDNGALSPVTELILKVATPIGNLFGQLVFGYLADIVGRKRMYGIELIIIVFSCFAQALSGNGPAVNIIGAITVWRFLMGIGVGGDYPLSAVITSEFAATRSRGRLLTAVFASQGWGNLAAAIVSLVVLSIFKDDILRDGNNSFVHMDICWRLVIGLGCVPGVLALYLRLTIPETPRFTMDVERNVQLAIRNIRAVLSANGIRAGVWGVDSTLTEPRVEAPQPSWRDVRKYFGQWENSKVLIGTCYSWFVLDIAFYGLGLNTSKVLTSNFISAVGIGSSSQNPTTAAFDSVYSLTLFILLISGTSLIPGYWASFLLIDRWGRKPIQIMGFAVLFVLFLIMGFAYESLSSSNTGLKVFVFIYCLTNFFQNFGPNVTSFVIPGEIFPTRYRATGHGISAASGKFGAIVAQIIFYVHGDSINLILKIFAFIMLTGIASTLLIPETSGKSLEELSNESQKGFIRGVHTFELRNGIVLRRMK